MLSSFLVLPMILIYLDISLSSSWSLAWNGGRKDLMTVQFFSKDKEGREEKDLDENLHHSTHCSLLIVPVLLSVPVVFLNRVRFLSLH